MDIGYPHIRFRNFRGADCLLSSESQGIRIVLDVLESSVHVPERKIRISREFYNLKGMSPTRPS